MPKPIVSRQTAQTLTLLLRCGMICREELEVVLQMIETADAAHPGRIAAHRR